MRSVIALYNTALARLGGNQFDRLNTPDDDSATATLCRTLYPHVLDMALTHHEWAFARNVAVLAAKVDDGPLAGSSGASETAYGSPPGWGRVSRYALPADCIRPVRLTNGGGSGAVEMEYVLVGRDVLTSAAPAVLEYVARVDDPVAWPPAFADAVAWSLASELATALVNDPRRQQAYAQQARQVLDYAAALERNSQRKGLKPSVWVTARE